MNQMVRSNHLEQIRSLKLDLLYATDVKAIAKHILTHVNRYTQAKRHLLQTEMYSELCAHIYVNSKQSIQVYTNIGRALFMLRIRYQK